MAKKVARKTTVKISTAPKRNSTVKAKGTAKRKTAAKGKAIDTRTDKRHVRRGTKGQFKRSPEPGNTTDSVTPTNPPARIAKLEASAELFLAGIKQAFSDPDEERLTATVRQLRKVPGVLKSAAELFESRPDDSNFRWGIAYLACKVGAPGTVNWLTRIALEKLPDSGFGDGCEGPRDGEVLVRVMAVEGLSLLVDSEGGRVVNQALTAIIRGQRDPAVQSAAVLQLLRLEPEARSRLRRLLPNRLKHFTDLQLRKSPDEVDQRPASLALDSGESPLPPKPKRGR